MNASCHVGESLLTHLPVRQERFFLFFSTSLHSGLQFLVFHLLSGPFVHVENFFSTCSLYAYYMGNVLNVSILCKM